MRKEANTLSPSTANRTNTSNWTGTQAYLFAAFCLLLGVALGYLFRGSASSPGAAGSTQQAQETHPQQQQADMQAALTQAAAPLVEAVNKNPDDYDSLVKLGNLFYDGQQYPSAVQYYERAVVIHPENVDVRTDLGTAYWYSGNADKAIASLETALKYSPGHPQTLFNLGWVRWQGKGDPKGAVEAWQRLLKANPDYPQREQVEQYIAKAKEHSTRGSHS
jgi:cytochrome c-type biogenesis protein CcmH/NrfG